MRQKGALTTAVEKLTDLLEQLTDKTSALATNLWEAIGDLRKNVGEVRTAQQAGVILRKSLEERVLRVEEDASRAWQLAESRNAVHRKSEDYTDKRIGELTTALQRLNERLSKLEGPGAQYALKGEVGMLGECLASHNARISKLEEIRGVMPLFKSSSEAGMIRAIPSILRMLHNPDFVRAVEEAGYKVDVESVIELVQKVVDEHEVAHGKPEPTQEVKKSVDLLYQQLP